MMDLTDKNDQMSVQAPDTEIDAPHERVEDYDWISWVDQQSRLYQGTDDTVGLHSSEAHNYSRPTPNEAAKDSMPGGTLPHKRLNTGTKRQHSSDKEQGKRSMKGKAKRSHPVPLDLRGNWRDPQEESSRGRSSTVAGSSLTDPSRSYAQVVKSPVPPPNSLPRVQIPASGSQVQSAALSGQRSGLARSRHAPTLPYPVPSGSTSIAQPQAGISPVRRGKQARDRARKERTHRCNEHDRNFGSRRDLERHYIDMHDTWPDGTPIEDILCPWITCTRNFRRSQNLSEHIRRRHGGQQPEGLQRRPDPFQESASRIGPSTGTRPLQLPTETQPLQERSTNPTATITPMPAPDADESNAAADLEAAKLLQLWQEQDFDPAHITILMLTHKCTRLFEELKRRRQRERWFEDMRHGPTGEEEDEQLLIGARAKRVHQEQSWLQARAELDKRLHRDPAIPHPAPTGAAAALAAAAPVPAVAGAQTAWSGTSRAGAAGRVA